MSATGKRPRGTDTALTGAAVLMILCCVAGPAALGAAVGAGIGGWLGIVCAVLLAAGAAVLLRRRGRSGGC